MSNTIRFSSNKEKPWMQDVSNGKDLGGKEGPKMFVLSACNIGRKISRRFVRNKNKQELQRIVQRLD